MKIIVNNINEPVKLYVRDAKIGEVIKFIANDSYFLKTSSGCIAEGFNGFNISANQGAYLGDGSALVEAIFSMEAVLTKIK